MKSIPFLLLAGFLILPNSVSLAQAPQQPQRVPDGGTREGPNQHSHPVLAERAVHRHREYRMDSAIAGRQHDHPEESPCHRP